jgi:CRISPR-associated endonuclease Csn1
VGQHKEVPLAKRQRLLRKESEEEGWKERSLNDTRYIATECRSHLERALLPPVDGSRRVMASSGGVTAKLRWLWGIEKIRGESHLHHAVDAMVTACVEPGTIQAITKHFQKRELAREEGEEYLRQRLPLPWDGFRLEVGEVKESIFVSRMPRRTITGRAHQETIRSRRKVAVPNDQGTLETKQVIFERKALANLTSADLDKIIDQKRNKKLIEALADRLNAFDGEGERAFREPFFVPGKIPGTLGAQVKSVLVETGERSGVAVRGKGKKGEGIASNGDMIRIDVFRHVQSGKKQDKVKHYIVPVYASQFSGKNLPKRAITANKPEEEWTVVSDDFEFMFSAYPNDLLEVDDGRGKVIAGYYVGAHRGTAAIGLAPHDQANSDAEQIGSKTVKTIRKYEVDPLGNRREILPGTEKRRGMENCSHRKRSAPSM